MTTKHLHPALLKHLAAGALKVSKPVVERASINPDGESIRFTAKSADGRLELEGRIIQPQEELDLDEEESGIKETKLDLTKSEDEDEGELAQ